MRNPLEYISRKLKEVIVNPCRSKGKAKIFGIGRNKTGTTSLKKAFEDLEITVGNQRKAESFLPDYKAGSFGSIINYCKSAQFFQDFPFSFPETYKKLDEAYPGSKFILTVRDSPEQWYKSLVSFHAKRFGKGQIPSINDLQDADYVWKGWIWECNRLMYHTPESDPYNRDLLIKSYVEYNETVREYFRNRPNDFIEVNVSEQGAYQRLMNFLNIESPFTDFPWENRTDQIKI